MPVLKKYDLYERKDVEGASQPLPVFLLKPSAGNGMAKEYFSFFITTINTH